MDCCGCIIPLLFIGVIGVIIYFVTNADKQMLNDSWGRFAASFGLVFTPGNFMMAPQVSGKYNGFDFLLHRVTRDSQTDKGTYTEIVMRVPPCGDYNLELYRKDFLFRVMAESVIGSERFAVNTDDEVFDANFIIKSHTPEKVDIILTPEVRNLILGKKDIMHLVINVSSLSYLREIKWFTPQIISDAYVLKQMTEILTTIAINISKNRIGMSTERQIPEKDPFLPEKTFEPTAPENYLETSDKGYYYEEEDKSITFVKDGSYSLDDINTYEVEIEPEIYIEDRRETRIAPPVYVPADKKQGKEMEKTPVNDFSEEKSGSKHSKKGKSKKDIVSQKEKSASIEQMIKAEDYKETKTEAIIKPSEAPQGKNIEFILPSSVSSTPVEEHQDVTQSADPSHYAHETYEHSLYSADTKSEETVSQGNYTGDTTYNSYTPEEVDSSAQYIDASQETYADEVTQTADPSQYASDHDGYDTSHYTADTPISHGDYQENYTGDTTYNSYIPQEVDSSAQYIDASQETYADEVTQTADPSQYASDHEGYDTSLYTADAQAQVNQYDSSAYSYDTSYSEVPCHQESAGFETERTCPCCASLIEAGMDHCKICGMQVE